MKNYVITVARGFGSGGKVIASKIADKLGIECYENRILTMASLISGMDEHYFEAADERLTKKLSEMDRSSVIRPRLEKFVADEQLFDYQAQIIRKLADTCSCVIVGKCADYVLRNYPNVVSVYIEAPRDFCVERIMDRMNVSEEGAHKLIAETDQYRAEYYRHYTNGNYWTNPVNYDITLNSARVGIDGCVDVIIDYLHRKLGP